MSLSPAKLEILKTMLLLDKPARATQVAEATGQKFPPVMMHLLGLIRMGYVDSPEKGLYIIAANGKTALGIPELSKETAKAILADAPKDKAFHFYACIGKPLDCYAHSLPDFCYRILKISADSLEFHLNRGDFENWFTSLGDMELARKIALLKDKNLAGEELRSRLYEIVENRRAALAAAQA